MIKVFLQPHDISYAAELASMIATPSVQCALALKSEDCTPQAMIQFIRTMQLEEMEGHFYSRMIRDEQHQLIGVITLKNIDEVTKTCHMSTWIAEPYWGRGYNFLAKEQILYTAFAQYDLQYVFAGARSENLRSRKSQRKLPYMTMRVEEEFASEHRKLERLEQTPCVLNVIKRFDFLNWYNHYRIAG
ncbi:GNAT family N-acetyltransferase [Kurthia sp. Dielmo]|uniref:GNAT family N-acetyltransferase n=1 Tax=Kurthia sp. Dielmo TaxID=1033738 RepID=UPI0002ECBCEB|nr:GNAT family N-acetyltransferase [Kurthia sp. Dielmo]